MYKHFLYTTTTGKDPKKFCYVPDFEKYTKYGFVKLVASGFRCAGKIRDFLREHAIAKISEGDNFNGFGYADHYFSYLLSQKDAASFQTLLEERKAARRPSDPEKKKLAWARSLSRLTGVSVETAVDIAEEKLQYRRDKIDEMYERQYACYSSRREKLINKMVRENPLRKINGKAHARRILEASVRHNDSNYEMLLEAAKDRAKWGEMTMKEARQEARQNADYTETVETKYKIS